MKKLAEKFGIAVWAMWFWSFLILLVISGIIIRGLFLTFIDSHEIAYEYNKSNGNITVLDRTGYFWVTPFVTAVHGIDGRPMQVRIEANNRVLNAKLVRFVRSKEGVVQFVGMHGRQDYEQTTLSEMLKSYAYENIGEGYSESALEKKYKFLEIMSLGTNTVQPPTSSDSLKILR